MGGGTGPSAQAFFRRVPWGFCLCCPGCPVLGSAGHLASDISLVGGLVSQLFLSRKLSRVQL